MASEKVAYSREECAEEIKKSTTLFAKLYYHFANVMVEELGDKEGRRLISKALENFGTERGSWRKTKIQETGLEPTRENMLKVSDLPRIAWKRDLGGGITYCPYADTWQQMGKRAIELGKLYCTVDYYSAKAYDPNSKAKRTKWLLEGDTCCKYE